MSDKTVQHTPWAILLCRWNDDNAPEARPRNFFERLFTEEGRGTRNIVDFFDEASHGHIDVGGSEVFGWIRLPQNRSDYKGSGANQQGRQDLINWAKQAVANGVDLSQFFNVVVCMNATPTMGTDLFGGGGGVVCDTNVLELSVLGQEMGHGYGLEHSRQNGSTADYRDPWDIMSTWDSCYMQPHSNYGRIGPGLNAANMAGRGWLDESRVWSSGSTSFNTTIQLRPLSRRDLPGYLAARLGDYIVEFRNKDRWDEAIPRSAVLVHRFEDNHSYLMSANNGHQDLVGGSVFGDPVTRLDVVEINESDQFATIRLEHHALSVPSVGPGILFGGIAEGGDGLVFVGGKIIRIPPRSPLIRVLEQAAAYEGSSAIASAEVRDAVRREALSTIVTIAQQRLQTIQTFTQPAPLQQVDKSTSGEKRANDRTQ